MNPFNIKKQALCPYNKMHTLWLRLLLKTHTLPVKHWLVGVSHPQTERFSHSACNRCHVNVCFVQRTAPLAETHAAEKHPTFSPPISLPPSKSSRVEDSSSFGSQHVPRRLQPLPSPICSDSSKVYTAPPTRSHSHTQTPTWPSIQSAIYLCKTDMHTHIKYTESSPPLPSILPSLLQCMLMR